MRSIAVFVTALAVLIILTLLARAQAPSPLEDAVATQIGRLVLQNQQLAAGIAAVRKELEETLKKCGKPCEKAPQSPAPAPADKK